MAYLLARRGLQVLILEKERLPRYKTCGGGVTLKALQNLPFDASPVIENCAVGGILTYRGEEWMRVETGWPIAWLVMRDRFDHFLVQQAVQAGAKLLEGEIVTGVRQEEGRVLVQVADKEYAARMLAGADGVNSIVARCLGLLTKRPVGVAIEAELEIPPSGMEKQGAYATFDFGALSHGYGWIFPKRDHLSAGVFQSWPRKSPGLRQQLERFIASQPTLRQHRVLHLQGHHIPLGSTRETLHKGRSLLVGDAANLADPWLGEGIYYALVSARLAAEVMFTALQKGCFELGNYTRLVHQAITTQLVYADIFSELVYLLPGVCSWLISRSRSMQGAVFSALRGNLTLAQMTTQLLVGSPLILAEALLTRPG